MQNESEKQLKTTLHDIQQQFLDSLFKHEGCDISFIKNQQHQQFSIYQGSVLGNLSSALADVFPVCKKLLGEDYFIECCYKFIYEHPPKSISIFEFGYAFPAFFASLKELKAIPYIVDTASLEWFYHRVFHAKKANSISMADLSAIPSVQHEKLIFNLSPELMLINSHYPLLKIWHINQANWLGDGMVKLDESQDNLVIWRYLNTSCIELIDNDTLFFLQQTKEGVTLGGIIDKKPNLNLDAILPLALEKKWITGFYF